jgi:two-component system, NtrC family, sensor histidine kinase HydH
MNADARRRRQMTVLALLFLGMGAAHLLVNPHAHQVHDFLFKGTYVQIILAALWFGLRGGLVMSGATSILYLFHILMQLRGHGPHSTSSLILELLLYNVIAVVTGLLSERQVRAQRALEATTEDLERSYRSLRDKTRELLTLEEQLRRADRLHNMGELAAGMAHELRNPLGGIQGAAEILARAGTTPEGRAEFASVLTREIARLDRVIGDFLSYARPRGDGPQDVQIDEVIDSVLRLLDPQLRRGRVTVNRETGSTGCVRADGEHLKQVFLNLILNAAQAMPEGGALTLTSRSDEETVSVLVQDTGVGIPEAIRDRFREPFVTTRRDGTGLGLSIADRILQGAGGALTLVRTGPTGTVFEVRLPVAMGDR